MLDIHTQGMDISLYNQSALLAALEIFVEGNVLLRDTSAVMFEILFPDVQVCFFSVLLLSVCVSARAYSIQQTIHLDQNICYIF